MMDHAELVSALTRGSVWCVDGFYLAESEEEMATNFDRPQ